jgi:hypothetical protein
MPHHVLGQWVIMCKTITKPPADKPAKPEIVPSPNSLRGRFLRGPTSWPPCRPSPNGPAVPTQHAQRPPARPPFVTGQLSTSTAAETAAPIGSLEIRRSDSPRGAPHSCRLPRRTWLRGVGSRHKGLPTVTPPAAAPALYVQTVHEELLHAVMDYVPKCFVQE